MKIFTSICKYITSQPLETAAIGLMVGGAIGYFGSILWFVVFPLLGWR